MLPGRLPGHRARRVPLADCAPQARPLVTSVILTAFKKLWGNFFGPRMEHIFRNCLLALL
jgi:hypothetical protein